MNVQWGMVLDRVVTKPVNYSNDFSANSDIAEARMSEDHLILKMDSLIG